MFEPSAGLRKLVWTALASASVLGWGGEARLSLDLGWAVQSSAKVLAPAEALSSPGFKTQGWYATTVPATVVGVQAASGELADPFVGMNMRGYPGMTYPIGYNTFNNLPMDPASPYAVPWWFRTEAALPADYAGRTVWLHFRGINYRADLWINGRKVADSRDLQGAYRVHELDVTAFVKPGAVNAIALKVHAPTEQDLGINWVDWNPTPPDKNTGLWGDVYVTTSGPVALRHPFVATRFKDASLAQADLTVKVDARNATDHAVKGTVVAILDGVRIAQDVEVAAGSQRQVVFEPGAFAALRVKDPKVWWPAEVGEPALHDLSTRFVIDGRISDQTDTRFGIREMSSELTPLGHRLFKVNRHNILIRGAAWCMDVLLRPSSKERLEAQLRYVSDMHLNTIRLEARLDRDEFFDLCDKKGLLVMAGWCCCDNWEQWAKWRPGLLDVAEAQLREQALRLRSHPSVFAWLIGSDGPPPPAVEKAYVEVLEGCSWPNSIVNSAADATTPRLGPSGVKMTGPYDYEPPAYWLTDSGHKWGGAYGFNTETSPGPAVPPLESLRKMFPPEHLWPMDAVWDFHGAGERFIGMEKFVTAMTRTYGKPADLPDFLRKAQAMAYDGQRAMMEAHGRNKYEATGVVQWMLNNAWPSTFWHLFDSYLYPAGGYFGTKKGCEPLHIQFSYDDRGVALVNSRHQAYAGLRASARVLGPDLKESFAWEGTVGIGPDACSTVAKIPAFPKDGRTRFLKLALRDASGAEVSSNFYWLPVEFSTLAWDKTPDSAFTPIATFEDLTDLEKLPRTALKAEAAILGRDGVRVRLSNPSANLAFQVHLGIRKAGAAEELLPVIWEDNYVSLLPGETRELTASYLEQGLLDGGVTLRVDGWNVEPLEVNLGVPRR
jgi:exo-1,4-beta-D-glucosaminidase